MNHKENFEELLCLTLDRMASHLEPNLNLTQKIEFETIQREKEKKMMKKMFTKRKIAALAACSVLILGGVAYGAGKITGLITQGRNDQVYEGIMPKQIMLDELGSIPKYVESFDNGFVIENSHIQAVNAVDAENNIVGSSNELSLDYINPDKEEVTLAVTAHPDRITSEADEGAPQQTFEYKGIALGYSKDRYKFVPPNYEPTAEEELAVQEGRLYLSYGSSEIQTEEYSFIQWKEDNKGYLLMTKADLSAEELKAMAEQIIDAK